MSEIEILTGNSLEVLKDFDDNSIHSVVTDPPYGLSFMGKKWDYDVPQVELWEEVMRVLKPGGHLLSFAGSRTYHRMAVNIEDAGFEIRDQIMWVYGSGFPKSHNIGKAVDKLQGNEREVTGSQTLGGNAAQSTKEKGGTYASNTNAVGVKPIKVQLTKGNSPWEGWGTALKPAHEPIVVARKPFKGTVAENVLEWGTAGLNIDGSRIGDGSDKVKGGCKESDKGWNKLTNSNKEEATKNIYSQGRFPANFIHDGSDEATDPMGDKARYFYSAKASKSERNKGLEEFEKKETLIGAAGHKINPMTGKKVVDIPRANVHPTVKPVDLMRYLVKLVTPPDGTVLDPFNGSGTTGIACKIENFNYIGIEMNPEYVEISEARIAAWGEEDGLEQMRIA